MEHDGQGPEPAGDLDPKIRRCLAYAFLNAKTRGANEISIEDLLVGLREELERGAADSLPSLRAFDKMGSLFGEDVTKAVSSSAEPLGSLPSGTCASEGGRSAGFLKRSSELDAVLANAENAARGRSSASITLDDLMRALSQGDYISASWEKYDVQVTSSLPRGSQKAEVRQRSAGAYHEAAGVASLEAVIRLFSEWMSRSVRLSVSFVPGGSSPDRSLGVRFQLVGRVALMEPVGLVRVEGSAAECLIDLRGASFKYSQPRGLAESTGTAPELTSASLLEILLASGDRCTIIAEGGTL